MQRIPCVGQVSSHFLIDKFICKKLHVGVIKVTGAHKKEDFLHFPEMSK